MHRRERRGAREHRLARDDRLDLDLAASLLGDTNPVRRGVREVDHPPVQERAAVVDAHDHALARRDVGHARIGGQRQRRVGGRHRVHVVGLADRRLLAMELAAVPRCDAALLVRAERRRGDVVAAEHRVRTVGRATERLEPRARVGDRIEIGRDVFAWAVVLVVAGLSGRRSWCRRAGRSRRRRVARASRKNETGGAGKGNGR